MRSERFDIHASVAVPTPSIPKRMAGVAGHGTSAPLVTKSSSRGEMAQTRSRKRSDYSQYTGTEYTGLDE